MLAPPLPHTENSVFRRFCHKPPSPRRRTLFVGKSPYKKTVKLIIFHPRAGRPGGIRASDLEAPYQNCLVVQRAAKRPFAPPYLPPNSGILAPMSAPPLPHTPSNSHFVRRVKLRLAYRLAFVIKRQFHIVSRTIFFTRAIQIWVD